MNEMMTGLFVKMRDKQASRVSLEELTVLVRQGSFGKDDQVWNEELSIGYAPRIRRS